MEKILERPHAPHAQPGIGVVTLSTLLASPSALARENPPAEDEPAALEALVVTGEKRERSLKDTASSVSLTSARDIDRKQTGNASVAEVINGSPNVVYTDSVGAPIIRGQDTQGPNNGQNVFWAAQCRGRRSTSMATT